MLSAISHLKQLGYFVAAVTNNWKGGMCQCTVVIIRFFSCMHDIVAATLSDDCSYARHVMDLFDVVIESSKEGHRKPSQ